MMLPIALSLKYAKARVLYLEDDSIPPSIQRSIIATIRLRSMSWKVYLRLTRASTIRNQRFYIYRLT